VTAVWARRVHLPRMDRRPRPRLVLVQGGRPADELPHEEAPPPPLRLLHGGPGADVQADLEAAIATARRIRQEIQARIARALEDPPA
jgi:hypothetical protein